MALACISGWPDAPDSPLHSRAADETGACAGGVEPVVVPDDENSARTSNCANEGIASAATNAAPSKIVDGRTPVMPIALVTYSAVIARLPMGKLYGCSPVNMPPCGPAPSPGAHALSVQSDRRHETDSQSRIPGRTPRHPLPAGHQGD